MAVSKISESIGLVQESGLWKVKVQITFNEPVHVYYTIPMSLGNFGYTADVYLPGSHTSRIIESFSTGSTGFQIVGDTITYSKTIGPTLSSNPGWQYNFLLSAGSIEGADGSRYGGTTSLYVQTPLLTGTVSQFLGSPFMLGVGPSTGETFFINDTSSNIAEKLDQLQANLPYISGIHITQYANNQPMPVTAIQASSASGTLNLITLDGGVYNVIPSPSTITPTYAISGESYVNEGSTDYLQIQTTGLAVGSVINYTVSGIDVSRVSPIGYGLPGGFTPSSPITSLNNYVMVNDSGRATINLQILNNNHTDGPTTAVVSIANGAATYSVLINDTSLTPNVAPAYTFIGGPSEMDEGQSEVLLLHTTGVVSGTYLQYTVSGIDASRLASGSTTGYVTVDSNGQASINLGVLANNQTDGPTTAVVSVGNGAAYYSVLVNDTSLTSTRTNYITITNPNSITNLTSADDQVTGSAGIDTVAYTGTSFEYNVIRGSSFRTLVVDNFSGEDSSDVLINVERIKFSDTNLALDIDLWDNAGSAYRLYKAAFDRTPDESGLGYWMDVLDDGGSLQLAASGFIHSAEFQSLYGANPSDTLFLTKLYNNVLDRDPDQGGLNYWIGQLNGGMSRESALINFSESNENVSNVAALIGNGIQYQPWLL